MHQVGGFLQVIPFSRFISNILFFKKQKCIVVVGLWCLMPLPTIFQLYRGSQFYRWRKPEYPEKTTLSHNVVSSTPRHEGGHDIAEILLKVVLKHHTPTKRI
jgi:hypothetical protein